MFALFRNLQLRWKILLAPALLICVLLGIGAHALQMQRVSQATIDSLMAGPVQQSETVAEFSPAIWAAHARFYRLTATAANETDEKKIQASAIEAFKMASGLSEKLGAIHSA